MSRPPTADPDVAAFAAAVRERLHDLTVAERDDLTGDLEVNLAEQHAERGARRLGDPEDYARELRAAAGLPGPVDAAGGGASARGRWIGLALDDLRGRWEGAVGDLPGRPWELVASLQPSWWVLRAWVALSTVDLLFGGGSIGLGLSLVPSLLGWGGPLLVVAVLVSLLVGTRRMWPGRGGVGARLTLLLVNLTAAALTPVTVMSLTTAADVVRWYGLAP